jgi:hypothetical protein
MKRSNGRNEIRLYTDKTILYIIQCRLTKMSHSSCSAKDVQVSVVALTDLLPNLWLETLSTNNKNLKQCIPFRGDNSRTLVVGTYQALPTQTICSFQRAMKIMTIIVSILIIIPSERRWPGTRHWCSETQYVV